MATKRPQRIRRREPDTSDTILDDLLALVRSGRLTMAAAADNASPDMVLVPVSDDSQADREVDPETRREEDRLLFEEHTLPTRLREELANDATALWEHFKRTAVKPMIEAATGQPFREVWQSLAEHDPDAAASTFASVIMVAGFDAALARYAEELRHVPELAAFYAKRSEGAERGRHTQAQRKADRERHAHRLLAEGQDVAAIATALGCSVRTVYRLLASKPPADA